MSDSPICWFWETGHSKKTPGSIAVQILDLLSNLFSAQKCDNRRRRAANPSRLSIEQLEDRVVLYAVSGNAWPNPDLITISFEPDGTNLGGVYSNLNSALSSLSGWQNEI